MTEYNNIAGLLEVSNTCLYKKTLETLFTHQAS